jgi:CRISPR-associated protein (TIGR02710 family)
MAKTLIITLGTGAGVESGIARSIQVNHPDRICFVATRESLDTLKRVESKLGRPLTCDEPCLVEDGNDVEDCCATVEQLIRATTETGGHPEEIFVDFTSGTKAMSAGAVLAAIGLECGGVVYVTGKRGANGRVISGTERVITIAPNRILIESRRRLIENLFNAFQYEACLRIIQDVRNRAADQDLQVEWDHLSDLLQAYSWWDRFDHQKALHHFSRLPKGWGERWHIDTSRSKEMVSRIARQRERYAATGDIKVKYGDEMLADLLANAERRARQGKYDDAIARLYRAIELVAQLVLSRRGIDTSNARLEDFPDSLRETYADASSPLRIGQEKAFSLLQAMGEEIGRCYWENKTLRNYLGKRNSSILAHGIEPVSQETYHELSREVHHLASIAFPRLSFLEDKCRFPQLELR